MITQTDDPNADAQALIVGDGAADNAPARDIVRLADAPHRDNARAPRFTGIVIGDDNQAEGMIVVDGARVPGIVLTRTALIAVDDLTGMSARNEKSRSHETEIGSRQAQRMDSPDRF